jgi:LysR family transcriptional regulator, transcriptional activator of nhaA
MLLPSENSTVRRAIDHWFNEMEIYPKILGQFDDSAFMKAFGQAGVDIFFMPTVIAKEVCKQFDVKVVGKTDAIKESFYAISTERKIRHPAVAAICDTARDNIFL